MSDDRAASLARIRAHLAALGYDTRDVPDADLEAGIQQLGQAVGRFGVTAEQAVARLRMLAATPLTPADLAAGQRWARAHGFEVTDE